jgi:hypothetical protein
MRPMLYILLFSLAGCDGCSDSEEPATEEEVVPAEAPEPEEDPEAVDDEAEQGKVEEPAKEGAAEDQE